MSVQHAPRQRDRGTFGVRLLVAGVAGGGEARRAWASGSAATSITTATAAAAAAAATGRVDRACPRRPR